MSFHQASIAWQLNKDHTCSSFVSSPSSLRDYSCLRGRSPPSSVSCLQSCKIPVRLSAKAARPHAMSFLALRPSCQCLRSSTISPSARLSAHAFASRVTCGRRYATATSIPGSAPQTSNPKPGPPKPNSPYTIFERQVKTQQKDRAAQRRLVSEDGQSYKGEPGEASRLTDYVRTAIAENISERLLDIKRQFGTMVEIGSGPGSLRHVLDAKRMKLEKIIMCDSSGEWTRSNWPE